MSDGNWQPWKMFAIGMGLVAVTAVITAAVVADWSGRPSDHQAATNASTTSRPHAVGPAPGSAAPAPRAAPVAPAIPTQAAIDACNQYAAAQVGQADKTAELVKDAAIGAALGAAVGAAGGAIADGGKGAGKGAAIGGVLGVGGGTLYGLNENKQHDRRYRDAYAACMGGRGYSG